MIVDAHHHLWDPARRAYPWMPAGTVLEKAFDMGDLRAVAEPAGVSRTVLVQTVSDVAETEEFLATARASDGLISGVVGWVELTAPDIGDLLDRLRARPDSALLVGVRHQVHNEPDPEWLLRPEVLRGLRAVRDRGLAYDLLVRSRELPAAVAAVQAVDGLTFVVDHAAKPEIARRVREPWRTRLAELARHGHVRCKLSGLVTEADWIQWTVEDLRPYAETVLELFGPDRVMFGSDWPVCTLAASYDDVLDAARALLANLSDGERASVLAETAVHSYRLTFSAI